MHINPNKKKKQGSQRVSAGDCRQTMLTCTQKLHWYTLSIRTEKPQCICSYVSWQKHRLKGKPRHWRVPASHALLAAWGSQIPPQLAISGRLCFSSSAKQPISPSICFQYWENQHTTQNIILLWLNSHHLLWVWISWPDALLTQGVLSVCLATNQHLEGRPAASLLLHKFCPVCLQCSPTLIYVQFIPGQFFYFHWHWRSVFKDKSCRLQYATTTSCT